MEEPFDHTATRRAPGRKPAHRAGATRLADDGERRIASDASAGGEPRQGRGRPSVRHRSREPQHRRRRAGLLGALALLLLIVLFSRGSDNGPVRAHAARTGYLATLATLAGNGHGSFVAEEQAAENAAIDRTLAYTPLVQVAGAQHREIALTFDDGPGPYTADVLSVLERLGAPATFFTVGSLERYFHDATSRTLADGYPIEDHTQTHAPMSKLSAADQRRQVLQQISAMGDAGAPFPRLFRPPYGLYDQTTLNLLRPLKLLSVLWTIDTEDYRLLGVPAIVSKVLGSAQPGAIVLMHDGGGPRRETVEALPQIIQGLRDRGYKLVTVPRLLLDNPAPADQQVSHSQAGGGAGG